MPVNAQTITWPRVRGWLQGNSLVLAILRSPVHRVLSGVVLELRYTGRRSGREYAIPVEYARSGERVVVRPQAAGRARWWRNFGTPMPVTVRLAGQVRHARALAVEPDQPQWEPAAQIYRARRRGRVGPLVVISLDPQRAAVARTPSSPPAERPDAE
jgi:hypothetical protein